MSRADMPTIDVAPGTLSTPLPPLDGPVFVRLVRPAGELVDRARQAFLRVANVELRACTGGWRDGGGVLIENAGADASALASEVHAVGRVLAALADETIARSYLEMTEQRVADGERPDPTTRKGG